MGWPSGCGSDFGAKHMWGCCFCALRGVHLACRQPCRQGWGVARDHVPRSPLAVRMGDTQHHVRSIRVSRGRRLSRAGAPSHPTPRRSPRVGGRPWELARLAEPQRRRPVSVSSRRKPTPSTLKAGELRTHVSRCQVCMRRT